MAEDNQTKVEEKDAGPAIRFYEGKKNQHQLFVWIGSAYRQTIAKARSFEKDQLRKTNLDGTWEVPMIKSKREMIVAALEEAAKAEQLLLSVQREERAEARAKAKAEGRTLEDDAEWAAGQRERAISRDAGRILVAEGAHKIGAEIASGEKSFAIAHFGSGFDMTEKNVADMNERFGTEFKPGDRVCYAYDVVPASVLAKREREAAQAEGEVPSNGM